MDSCRLLVYDTLDKFPTLDYIGNFDFFRILRLNIPPASFKKNTHIEKKTLSWTKKKCYNKKK